MSSKLIDERPLILLPSLAKKIGLNEAVFMQQIHFWLLMKKNVKDGYYWTYNTHDDWLEQFPFWSKSTLRRIIDSLIEKDLIVCGRFNKKNYDKTKWYRINYHQLHEVTKDIEIFDGKATVQNEKATVQNEQMDVFNMDTPIPKTNTKTNIKDIKTLTQQVASELEEQFEQLWSFYPKKVNKKKAFDKFKLKLKKHDFDTILKGVASYAKVMELNGTEKQYIKGPEVFLNGEHYLDDQSELLRNKSNNNQQQYKPWEELAYGTETNSSANDYNSQQLPTTTKQIGW